MNIHLESFGATMPDKTLLENIKLVKRPGSNSHGIEEILNSVDFGISFINSLVNVYADGKLGLSDLQFVLGTLLKAPKALAGLDKIPEELDDLNNEELEQLVTRVEEGLGINTDKAMDLLRFSIDWVYSTYNLLKATQE